MHVLTGKHILLGVTGGIAAYKSAELVRQLRRAGAEVRVVMTAAATGFVTPLTFQALSGRPVHTELLDAGAEAAMGHIELARWADLVLVAPATADSLARLAAGRADDLLCAVCLASEAPLAVAPAMNQAMWRHAATRDNLRVLEARGVRVLGPGTGEQACGDTGPGRMLEPNALVEACAGLFRHGALTGQRVVVTAGPTREPLDPVRFLGNRSSGRMGFAVAAAAAEAGARVLLVSGPVNLPTPAGVERIDVDTAVEMHAAVMAQVETADIFIGVAAVADYRPAQVAPAKLKKGAPRLSLELVRNPDILAEVAARKNAPFTVGFAAETDDVLTYARGKLQAKGVDMIAANLVGPRHGFDAEENALHVLWADGEQQLARTGKGRLARQLVAIIAAQFATIGRPGQVIRLHGKDSA